MPWFYPGASLLKEWYLGHRYPLPLEVACSGEGCGHSEHLGHPNHFSNSEQSPSWHSAPVSPALFPGAVDEEGRMPFYAEECASMLAVTFSGGDKMLRSIVSASWAPLMIPVPQDFSQAA